MHNKVREIRKCVGLTQGELADKAGLSRPYLSHVENGQATPSVEKAAALAKALGRTMNDLFDPAEWGGVNT